MLVLVLVRRILFDLQKSKAMNRRVLHQKPVLIPLCVCTVFIWYHNNISRRGRWWKENTPCLRCDLRVPLPVQWGEEQPPGRLAAGRRVAGPVRAAAE